MLAKNKLLTEMPDTTKPFVTSAQHPLEKRLARIESVAVRLRELVRSPSLVQPAAGSQGRQVIAEISAVVDVLTAELQAARESGRRSDAPARAKSAKIVTVPAAGAVRKPPEKHDQAAMDTKNAAAAGKIDQASLRKVLIMQKPHLAAAKTAAPTPIAPTPVAKPAAAKPAAAKTAVAKQPPAGEETAARVPPEQAPSPGGNPKPKSEVHQKVAAALAQITEIVNKQHDRR